MKIIRLLFVTIALSITLGTVGYCIYAAKVKILIIPVEGQLKFTGDRHYSIHQYHHRDWQTNWIVVE